MERTCLVRISHIYICDIHIYVYVYNVSIYVYVYNVYISLQRLHITYIYVRISHIYIYMYMCTTFTYLSLIYASSIRLFERNRMRHHKVDADSFYGVATIGRLLKIIGLLCKRALQKRRYSAKATYIISKEPTNRSHPICKCLCVSVAISMSIPVYSPVFVSVCVFVCGCECVRAYAYT